MASMWDWFDTLSYHLNNQEQKDQDAFDVDIYKYRRDPVGQPLKSSGPVYNDAIGTGRQTTKRFDESQKYFPTIDTPPGPGTWEIPDRAYNGLNGMSQDRMPNAYPHNPSLKDWR